MSSPEIERARGLRRKMSPPEVRLWVILRARPGGFKFRRQRPFGPYVLDFFCAEAGLAIEVDGIVHSMGNNPEHDLRRDIWCAARGVKTMRIAAMDLFDEADAVIRMIVDECEKRAPSTAPRSPSPGNPGEEN